MADSRSNASSDSRSKAMLYSGKQIVRRIKEHIKKKGEAYTEWVVGVDKKPRARLFTNHGVQKAGDSWILMHAESSAVARKVHAYLVKRIGLIGEAPPKDLAADFVYAYMKKDHTTP
jgi:hypothetical protein